MTKCANMIISVTQMLEDSVLPLTAAKGVIVQTCTLRVQQNMGCRKINGELIGFTGQIMTMILHSRESYALMITVAIITNAQLMVQNCHK